jgi:hypothetical protein
LATENKNMKANDQVALILAKGAVALILTIAVGSFGRSFFLAVVLHEDHPISDAATQLLTAMGSALMGGAVGFVGGSNSNQKDDDNGSITSQP